MDVETDSFEDYSLSAVPSLTKFTTCESHSSELEVPSLTKSITREDHSIGLPSLTKPITSEDYSIGIPSITKPHRSEDYSIGIPSLTRPITSEDHSLELGAPSLTKAITRDDADYLEGLKLFLLLASGTFAAFLLMLDESVVSTVGCSSSPYHHPISWALLIL